MRRISSVAASAATVLLTTVVLLAGMSSSATAAVTPGQFNLHFTTAKVVLSDLAVVDVPGSDPSLAGKTIDILAGVDDTGTVTAYRNALTFPPVGLAGLPLTIGLSQTSKSTGQFDGATGLLTLPLNIAVTVTSGLISRPCTLPLSLVFDTAAHAVTASKSVTGAPYVPDTGAITLASVGTLPDVASIPASSCPPDAAVLLGAALPKGAPVGIELAGTLSMPGGVAPSDPDVGGDCAASGTCGGGTPPAKTCATDVSLCAKSVASAASSSFKVTKKGVSSAIRCAGTPATTKSCAGTVTLKATYKYAATVTRKVKGKKRKVKVTKSRTATVGTARYTAPAGGSGPVAFKVSPTIAKALKDKRNKKGLAGTLTVTNANGTGVTTKKVTIK